MSLLKSPPNSLPPRPFLHPHLFPKTSITFFKTPLKTPRKSISISSSSSPNSLPFTEQQIVDSIAQQSENKNLPGLRTFENDLARLAVVGEVSFQQALTAAAADGGEAADEHIEAKTPTMVVETVFPGPSDDRSTISTRLFLPTKKVKEKAAKLRKTVPPDILSGTTSTNILAMTFRQVVLQRIWSFELGLFSPGAERDMGDLEFPREASQSVTISSSDERVLSVIAEAVCMYVLEGTERDFREKTFHTTTKSIFSWFQKPRRIASKDFSVLISELPEDAIIENAIKCLKNFNKHAKAGLRESRKETRWWISTYAKLEKIGGPEFVKWAIDYIPAYRIEVDMDKLKNGKLEGWKMLARNRWEVHLTHSQMVGLAGILDMYYEDQYTIPNKQLSCGIVAEFTNLSKSKRKTSMWRLLSITLASGFIVFSINILAQFHWSPWSKYRKYPLNHCAVPLSAECYQHQDLETSKNLETIKLEGLCVATLEKIKDAVGWPGDIATDNDLGAWTGELPSYLNKLHDVDLGKKVVSGNLDGTASHSVDDTVTVLTDTSFTDIKTSAQDIASYQVFFSKDGAIVGFQPTSRLAVNYWASNPLAKELYKGQKLAPGFIEPGLKIPRPDEVIVIELLMSVNGESWFALARPIRESC